jgi:uncharacterized protein YndB with AHSA1/START domain
VKDLAVESSIWIAAPRERVWRAVTEPGQLAQWFAPGSPWEIPQLEANTTVKFHNTATEILLATIQTADPPQQFTLRWEPEEDGTILTTTFLLEEENDGTRITIRETGFESLAADIRQQRIEQTAAGYGISLENLRAYLMRELIPY